MEKSFADLLLCLSHGGDIRQEALKEISKKPYLCDQNGATFLHRKISIPVAIELVKMGMDVNAINDGQQTAVHTSAMCDNDELCQEFVTFFCILGANISTWDHNQKTPLMYAIEKGKQESAKVLISNGCRISRKIHINAEVDMLMDLWLFEKGVVTCRDVIVMLLGLKSKKKILPHLDRFLIKQVLAVEIWATRGEKAWQH